MNHHILFILVVVAIIGALLAGLVLSRWIRILVLNLIPFVLITFAKAFDFIGPKVQLYLYVAALVVVVVVAFLGVYRREVVVSTRGGRFPGRPPMSDPQQPSVPSSQSSKSRKQPIRLKVPKDS